MKLLIATSYGDEGNYRIGLAMPDKTPKNKHFISKCQTNTLIPFKAKLECLITSTEENK